MRVRPLYAAAAISGIAAALWHVALAKTDGSFAGDAAKRAGFDSASDYGRASEMVNRASIDSLDENDEGDLHRWLVDPKKQEFLLLALGNLRGKALLERFRPDLARIARRPGMAQSVETLLQVWTRDEAGRAFVGGLAKESGKILQPLAREAIDER